MQALLEYLPGLFEDKFRQRLQPMLDQQQRLLSENANLRQHLLRLQPGSDTSARACYCPSKSLNAGAGWPPRGGWADPTRR